MDGNVYVVMWDMYGVDGIVNATELNQQDVFNSLRDDNVNSRSLSCRIDAMLLRARMNSQRSYEIYSINVDEHVTTNDIASWFEVNPQGAADLIRSRGKRLLSQRNQTAKQVIT